MSKDQKYILHDDDREDGLLWLPYKTRSTEVKIKKFIFQNFTEFKDNGLIQHITVVHQYIMGKQSLLQIGVLLASKGPYYAEITFANISWFMVPRYLVLPYPCLQH